MKNLTTIKKLLIFFLFFQCFVIGLQGQVYFGLKLGVPFNMQPLNIENAEINSIRPLNLGMELDLNFEKSGFGFSIETVWEVERLTGKEIQDAVNTLYLICPIDAKWRFGQENFKFFVKAGPSFSITLAKSGTININNNTRINSYQPTILNWELNFGGGFIFYNHIQIEITYFYAIHKKFEIVNNPATNLPALVTNQGGFVFNIAYFF